jgi:hypothetical protein
MKEQLQNIYFESLINEICELKLNSAGQHLLKAALINTNQKFIFVRRSYFEKLFDARE